VAAAAAAAAAGPSSGSETRSDDERTDEEDAPPLVQLRLTARQRSLAGAGGVPPQFEDIDSKGRRRPGRLKKVMTEEELSKKAELAEARKRSAAKAKVLEQEEVIHRIRLGPGAKARREGKQAEARAQREASRATGQPLAAGLVRRSDHVERGPTVAWGGLPPGAASAALAQPARAPPARPSPEIALEGVGACREAAARVRPGDGVLCAASGEVTDSSGERLGSLPAGSGEGAGGGLPFRVRSVRRAPVGGREVISITVQPHSRAGGRAGVAHG